MERSAKNYKRVVVKISSSSLFWKNDICEDVLGSLVDQVALLYSEGHEVVIVSSGAIALGMHILGMGKRPKELSLLQAVAAIGQHRLMAKYQSYFEKKGMSCAQVLLTYDDFDNRKRYLNAKNTMQTILKLKAVPIVNENDTISTDEIKFGDNDKLSSLVASLVNADLLVMLSDVDGLLDGNKQLIRIVDNITPAIKALAGASRKETSVGGMVSKLEAARISMESGIPCVIANGCCGNIIASAVRNPDSAGTIFLPKKALAARKRWIAYNAKPKGKIFVDDGAKKALLSGKSLLSVGITLSEGDFGCSDVVSIVDSQGTEFARGKVSVCAEDVHKTRGKRSDKEAIHRDNIAVL